MAGDGRSVGLRSLLAGLPESRVAGGREVPDVPVGKVTQDSRAIAPGDVFVAYRGVQRDLHDFIPDAVRRGAVAIVAEREPDSVSSSTWVVVPSGRRAWALLIAGQLGYPARELVVIGVTGTDGKTTTSTLIHQVLTSVGRSAGLISTVSAVIGGHSRDTGFHTTTPDAPDVQRYLAEMVEAGARYAVLETTSHGLAQERTAGCEYDVAVVTNVTHEHLDLHGSDEAYVAAKGKLFQSLATSWRKPGVPKVSVLNADDRTYPIYRHHPADIHLTYALEAPADVRAADIQLGTSDTRFVARTPGGDVDVRLRLLGRYNVANALAATACGIGLGLEPGEIARGLGELRGVRGRFDPIDHGQPFGVAVDFAHTPNALARVLELGRTLARGRVIAVFGSAGLRDVTKRGLMGEAAGQLADFTVITAEDPRTESVEAICAEIAAGCERVGRRSSENYIVVADRGEAIARAVGLARAGDVVLICGKGHEQSMCYGTTEHPWSDHDAARDALAAAGYPESMRA